MQAPCQVCGKTEATIHLTEMEPGGGTRELHLCSACTKALGVPLHEGPPPIAALLEKSVASSSSDSGAESETTVVEAEEPCPVCGLEFSDYTSNNLFGCAHDYLAFTEELEPLLTRYHGSIRHLGRSPVHQPVEPSPTGAGKPMPSLASQRRRLESALKDAVSKERYEDAARLRDQLRLLAQGEAP